MPDEERGGDGAPSSFLEKERARLGGDFDAIQQFIFEREQSGELTREQGSEIDMLFLNLLGDAGISRIGSTALDVAVLRQGNHVMREDLKRRFPSYVKEIDRLDSSRGR
jgi:hypothetical protein